MNIKTTAVSVLILLTVGVFFFGYNIGSQLCFKAGGFYNFYSDRAWDEKKGTMYNLPILGSIYAMGLRASTSDCRETATRSGAAFPFD